MPGFKISIPGIVYTFLHLVLVAGRIIILYMKIQQAQDHQTHQDKTPQLDKAPKQERNLPREHRKKKK